MQYYQTPVHILLVGFFFMGDYFYPFWNENSSKITVSKNLLLIMVSVIIKANIKLVLSIYPTLSQIFYVYCSVVPHKNSMGQMLSSPHCTGETTEVQKCLHVPGRERGNSSSVTQLISGAAKTLTQGDGLQDPPLRLQHKGHCLSCIETEEFIIISAPHTCCQERHQGCSVGHPTLHFMIRTYTST